MAALLSLSAALPSVGSAQTLLSVQLRAEAARIFHDLAELRGLPAAGAPPPVVLRSREERRRFIASELARQTSPARLDAERRAMIAWGLIPADFDLAAFLTDLMLEQAAAYYDPVRKVMVLANWLGSDAQRDALAHELVHAIQDRQIGLDRFLTERAARSDETRARQALIEGEAVALAHDLALQKRGQDLARQPDIGALQRAIVTSVTGPFLTRAPRLLRAMLTFPYASGLGFIHQFRRRHPWGELTALYGDPPRSTAQILHPERYLDRREDPEPVTLPDLGPALGRGARRVLEDEAGEFLLIEVLRQFLGQAEAIGHWRGDRYALWEDGHATTILVALTVWESTGDARAYADASAQLLRRKHNLPAPTTSGALSRDAPPPPRPPSQSIDGLRPVAGGRGASERAPIASQALTAWQVGTRTFVVEQRERDVLTIERAPIRATAKVRRAIWDNRPAPEDATPTAPTRQRPARVQGRSPVLY